jgi:6-phosphogluconolactonase
MSFKKNVFVFKTGNEATEALLTWWESKTQAFANDHQPVSWALSGGKTPLGFYKKLAQSQSIDWQQIQAFLVDERDVDLDQPDSNYRLCMEAGLGERLRPEQFPAMRLSSLHSRAGVHYEQTLCQLSHSRLDLVLLGMGGDGHTASLFPGTAEANRSVTLPFSDQEPLVLAHELPFQPLPQLSSKWRITLTYKALSQAQEVAFLITGQDKAKRLHEIFFTDSDLPCAKVEKFRLQLGLATYWYLDEAAASLLEYKDL